MKPRTKTIIVMAVVAAILIAWDIYVMFFNDVDGDTESEILREWAISGVSALPCMFGILGSHWFWPTNKPRMDNALRIIGFGLALACVVNLIGFFILQNPVWWSPVAMVTGAAYGKVFWSNSGPIVRKLDP